LRPDGSKRAELERTRKSQRPRLPDCFSKPGHGLSFLELDDLVGEPVGGDGESGGGGGGGEELTRDLGTAVALHRDTSQGLAEENVV